MATWTFSAGVAAVVDTVGDTGPGLDNQVTFAVDVTATVWANQAGTVAVQVLDQNDAPSVVRAGSRSLFSPFATNTNLPDAGVWLGWGPGLPLQFHPSDQAMNSLPIAAEALATARTAAAAAEAAAAGAGGSGGGTGGAGGGTGAFFIAADDAAAADAPVETFILIRRAV